MNEIYEFLFCPVHGILAWLIVLPGGIAGVKLFWTKWMHAAQHRAFTCQPNNNNRKKNRT